MRSSVHVLSVVAFVVWACPTGAAAGEQETTLRVVRTAVIVNEPRGDADVVATVTPGVVLELLDESGSWYLVRPPDTTRGWRTGWINRAMVELLEIATTPAADPPRFPPVAVQDRTAAPTVETASTQDADKAQLAAGLGYARSEGFNGYGFGGEFAYFFDDVSGLIVGAGWSTVDIPIIDASAFGISVGPRFRFKNETRIVPSVVATIGISRATVSAFGVSISSTAVGVSVGFAIDVRLSDRVAIRAIEPNFGVSFDEGERATGFGFSTGLVFNVY